MQKTNLCHQGVRGGGEINWGIEIDMYTVLHIEQITNKDLLQTKESPLSTWEKNLKKSGSMSVYNWFTSQNTWH